MRRSPFRSHSLRRWRWLPSLWLWSFAAFAAAGDHEFQAGIAAYRAGDYAQAREWFLRAQRKGVADPNLQFDLGLASYKLGRYEEARTAFEALRARPIYAAIADYHLGLVAAKLGEDERAIAAWQQTERSSASPKLRELARLALHRLGAETLAPAPSWYVSLGLGYDTDPLLLSDALQTATGEQADGFVDLLASLDHPLPFGSMQPLSLRGLLYARQYFSDTDLSQQGALLALRYRFGNRWRTALLAQGETSLLDGRNLESGGGLGVETTRRFAQATLGLHYLGSRLDGSGAYRYLSGWRQRAGADYAAPLAGLRLAASYEFEWNDRADLSESGQFFSQSPLRHTLGARARKELGERWSLEADARLRYSRYREPDRFLDGSALVERRRSETLFQPALAARWRFTPTWGALLQYQYSHNRSSAEGYSYERHLIVLALEGSR